jgi:hypothetical protein
VVEPHTDAFAAARMNSAPASSGLRKTSVSGNAIGAGSVSLFKQPVFSFEGVFKRLGGRVFVVGGLLSLLKHPSRKPPMKPIAEDRAKPPTKALAWAALGISVVSRAPTLALNGPNAIGS